jgi:hypothetical protein
MWLHKEAYFTDTLAKRVEEGFAVKECTIAGDKCWLIFPPHMGVEWHKDNLIYRSGIWTNDGYPVSLSWKKFFNWDEQCELAPKPKTLDECNLINKEDGSTLLVSIYKGELVIRTRGASGMEVLDNGSEKDFLIEKYSKFFNFVKTLETSSFTYVFEWETPSNKIVIDYGDEPRLVFTGQITHDDYSYIRNEILDRNAPMLELERPPTYGFNSFESMQQSMSELKGIEGICIYYNDDQDIKKMKTEEYLMLHSVKFKLGYKNLIDMIYEENVCEERFKEMIERLYDYEGLRYVEHLINDIYLVDYTLKEGIMGCYWTIVNCDKPADRKEFAEIVFGKEERYKIFSAFLFKLYEMEDPDVRALLMKNSSLCTSFKKMVLDWVTK